jgi:probable rRNA maturation factor
MGIGQNTIVDVTFVNEDVMAELHMRYMGLPGPTDVLSFPATDVRGGPVDPKSLQDEPTLGDIVICPAFIVSNAQSQPTQMNIDACVIHAMLHLIGHDHHVEVGTEFMVSQEAVLTELWKSEQARQGV